MAEAPSANLPPEEVERCLSELAELHELGMALRDVRFVDPQISDRVRERPDPDEPWPSGGGGERRGS